MDKGGIAVADGLGRAPVNLEGDEALALAFGIAQGDAECPVDGRPDAITDGEDFTAVPVFGLDDFKGAVVPVELAAPAVFVIEFSPQMPSFYVFADVCLIAARLPFIVDFYGAELNARIAVGRGELDIDGEIKVFYRNFGPEKLVPANGSVRMADDGAVLDRPVALVAAPAGQVFAVEEPVALRPASGLRGGVLANLGVPGFESFEHLSRPIGFGRSQIVVFAFVLVESIEFNGFILKGSGQGIGVLHHEFPGTLSHRFAAFAFAIQR